MADICDDNRFEIIAKAKKALLEGTNIDMCADEMAVIDNILFRCWQMGWLDRYDTADTPQTGDYDFRDEQEYNDRWSTDCDRYVITNDEGDKAYNCIGCTQTDCGWK